MTQSTHNAPEATMLMVTPPAGIWCPHTPAQPTIRRYHLVGDGVGHDVVGVLAGTGVERPSAGDHD